MDSPKDWPIEKIVEEYERRKNSPTVKDLCKDLGITKQGLHYRVTQFYRKQAEAANAESQNKGAA